VQKTRHNEIISVLGERDSASVSELSKLLGVSEVTVRSDLNSLAQTGLVRRTGGSVRLVRSVIEIAVVATGWALGGTLGIATVLYALAIGPLVQILLPRLTVGSSSRTANPGTGRLSRQPTRS